MPRQNRARELAAYLNRPSFYETRKVLLQRFGRQALESALVDGSVVELLPGIMAHAQHSSEFNTRVRAVMAWLPRGSAVSGLAALSLHELTDHVPEQITVLVGRNVHLRTPVWIRVVRCAAMAGIQSRTWVGCTPRERAVIDAWCEATPSDRESVVLEAMRRSNLRGDSVLRVLAGMPRVRDRRRLEALLAEAAGGIQSFLELRAKRTVLNTPDFRDLRRQVEVFALGDRYVLDTLHEATGTVIEFDGARVHGTFAAKKRDNARDAALATLNLLTIRISYDDVMKRPAWCREVIRRTIAARAGGTQVRLNAV